MTTSPIEPPWRVTGWFAADDAPVRFEVISPAGHIFQVETDDGNVFRHTDEAIAPYAQGALKECIAAIVVFMFDHCHFRSGT